jgi:molybdenum cofactor cytidylyltransferase
MTLKEALGLDRDKMVSVIGAGGKTTTLYRLARELWERGEKVLLTTTTKIFKPASPHVHKLYLAHDLEALRCQLADIEGPMIVAAGSALDSLGKLTGLPSVWLDELAEAGEVDRILVEADGAASRYFKAPLEYEPVVPGHCPLILWVMAIKALGKPIGPETIHRSERVAALLGVEFGTPLTQGHILQLLKQPSGCFKGIPKGSRIIALFNQADSEGELQSARELGRGAIQQGCIERVVITSYLEKNAVREVIGS